MPPHEVKTELATIYVKRLNTYEIYWSDNVVAEIDQEYYRLLKRMRQKEKSKIIRLK